MRVIYCGFGRAGLECFYRLVSCFKVDFSDVIVFTHDAAENTEFLAHLKNNNIKFYFESVNKCHEILNNFAPDVLLSVYYRYIITSNILQIVRYKAMNLHPSLLPAYRGTKSSVWSIINAEKYTGISFHYITESIDDGRLILQKKVKIAKNDTAYSLYHKLISIFVDNFPKALKKLLDGYVGIDQIGDISYYKRELPFGGCLVANQTTYKDAERFVRAMYFPPFKGAFFQLSDSKIVEVLNLADLKQYKDMFRK